MADELNLEDIAVKIIGDPVPYVQALELAKRATSEFYLKSGAGSKEYQESMRQEKEIQKLLAADETARRKVLDEGKRVTESMTVVTRDFGREMANLKVLLDQGAISQDVFNRALAKTQQEMAATLPKVVTAGEAFAALAGEVGKAAAAMGILSSFQGALSSFMKVEAFNLKMNAAIESTGHDVETTRVEFARFAKEIGDTTNVTRLQTMGLLQQAAAYGQVGDKAQEMVKKAIGIAAYGQTSPEAAIRMLARMDNQPEGEEKANALKRMIPALFGIKDEALAAAKALEYMEKGFTLSQALGKTLEAQLNRDKDEIAKLNVEIGKFVGEGVKYLATGLDAAAGWLNRMDADARQAIVTLGGLAIGTAVLSSSMGILGTTIYNVTGALAGLAANPLTLVITGLAIAAVSARQIYEYHLETTGELGRINERLKEQQTINKEILDTYASADKFLLDKALDIKDVGERRKFLQDEKQQAQEMKDVKKKEMDDLNKQLTGPLVSTGRFLGSFIPGEMAAKAAREKEMLEQARKEWEAAGRSVESFQKALDAISTEKIEDQVTSFASRLKKEIANIGLTKDEIERKRLLDLGATPKMLKEVDDLVAAKAVGKVSDELQKQIDTIGMSTAEKKRYALATEGAKDADLEWIDTLIAWEGAAKAAVKLTDDISHLAESFQTEMDTMFMSANEKKLYKLESEGASEADLAHVKVLSDLDEVMKAHHDVLKQGEQTTKQFMTPYEKYTEAIQKYNTEFELGTIKYDTYTRAVKHAQDALEKADHAAEHAAGSFHAAAVGSAEAASRLETYLSGLNLAVKKANPFEPAGLNEAEDAAYRAKKVVSLDLGDIGESFLGQLNKLRSDLAADRAEAAFVESAATDDLVAYWEAESVRMKQEAQDRAADEAEARFLKENRSEPVAAKPPWDDIVAALNKIASNTDDADAVKVKFEDVEL